MTTEHLLNDDSLIYVDKEKKRNFAKIETSGNSFYVDISELSNSSVRHISPTIDQFDIRDSKETQPFDIASDEAIRVLLDIHFPSDASSSIYRGSIRYLGENKEILDELPLLAEVLPFDLKESGRIHGLFYRSKLSESGTISSENKSETQLRAELENIRSHGVNTITLYDGKNNAEAIKIYREFGFSKDNILFVDFKMDSYVLKDDLDGYLERARKIKSLISGGGVESVYIYGIDEAREDKISLQRKFWSAAKEQGVKVFATGYSETFPKMTRMIDLFVHAYKPSENVERSAHEAGVKVVSYANPQSGVENPERFRINYGVLLWAYNYDGSLVYAYQDSFGFIYNDFDHPSYRDHALVYPTSDGVINTLAWKGYREGIYDLKYISTLESCIDSVSLEGNESGSSSVKHAVNYLKWLKDKLRRKFSDKRTGDLGVDGDEVRKSLIKHIRNNCSKDSERLVPPLNFKATVSE